MTCKFICDGPWRVGLTDAGSFPFPLRDDLWLPLVKGTADEAANDSERFAFDFPRRTKGESGGGLRGKGRVSSRSAREYWWVIKCVWASQKASFGSSGV